MIRWVKRGKITDDEGVHIVYEGKPTTYYIISHKKQIPHANREGSWEHTTYELQERLTGWSKQFSRMQDAKEWVEKKYE